MELYLDRNLHQYYDSDGVGYKSVTTLIGEYSRGFSANIVAGKCAEIGTNPSHPKYWKYYNKTKEDITKQWKELSAKALARGNKIHNDLEWSMNVSNGYSATAMDFIGMPLFTIQDVIDNKYVGEVNLNILQETPMYLEYPEIYRIVEKLVWDGYKLYAEVGVKDDDVAGLIDLIAIKENRFKIIDYKSNLNPITDKAGYFEKDFNGKIIGEFICTNAKLKKPVNHLEDSVLNKFTLQVSKYAEMVEKYGLVLEELIICHIKEDNIVDIITPEYLKSEVERITYHYFNERPVIIRSTLW